MADIIAFPGAKRKALIEQYVYNPRQTPADVGFVTGEAWLIEKVQKHLSGMRTFTIGDELPEVTSLAGSRPMREICYAVLSVPQGKTVAEKDLLVIREFLLRLNTARFFYKNLDIDDT